MTSHRCSLFLRAIPLLSRARRAHENAPLITQHAEWIVQVRFNASFFVNFIAFGTREGHWWSAFPQMPRIERISTAGHTHGERERERQ